MTDEEIAEGARIDAQAEALAATLTAEKRVYLELWASGGKRFWEVVVEGSERCVREGAVGNKGSTARKAFKTEGKAMEGAQKLLRTQVRQYGYDLPENARASYAEYEAMVAEAKAAKAPVTPRAPDLLTTDSRKQWQKTLEAVTAAANLEARDHAGRTALILAAGDGNPALVRALIAAGADVNARSEPGQTALDAAARFGHVEIIDALLAAGAKVDLATDGYTELMTAATNGQAAAVDRLLAAGADPKRRLLGATLASLACLNERSPAVLASLQRAGADLNDGGADGMTPLHTAAAAGRKEIVAWLLGAGVDRERRNADGKTAFDLISRKSKPPFPAIKALFEA